MSNSQIGAQVLIRVINLSTVIQQLQYGGPLSRAQLARVTNLNKSTISSLVDDLLTRGLVYEGGIDTPSIGRPASLVKINPTAGSVIGVEFGVGFISVIVTDFTGKIIQRWLKEFDSTARQQDIISFASQLIDRAHKEIEKSEAKPLGIGVTVPGMVDFESGMLVFSPYLQWRNVPLRRIIHERTGLPVLVDNNANAAALCEHLFGLTHQANNFIFILAGASLGAGFFLNGNLYRGTGGFAGEIGHISLQPEQTHPCWCGNRYCWEISYNQSSLFERIYARMATGVSNFMSEYFGYESSLLMISKIAKAAEAGEADALEAFTEMGHALGLGVASLINTFNPEKIILGGPMSMVGEFLLPTLISAVKKHALVETSQQVEILLSKFGSNASVMGAVALVIQDILSNPTHVEPNVGKV